MLMQNILCLRLAAFSVFGKATLALESDLSEVHVDLIYCTYSVGVMMHRHVK